MKHNLIQRIKKLLVFSLLFVLCVNEIDYVRAENGNQTTLVEISTPEELVALAENCKLDVYSIGKRVELKNNIDMKGTDFFGIPYFNGIFDGNGYVISNVTLDDKGSQYGFFRYVGEFGVVSDLEITAKVTPEGSQEEIGGIVGVNYGTIQDCSFSGTVCGVTAVGGIAGVNASTGQILGCKVNALILATDNTGGIAGCNKGIIAECSNNGSINIEELETVMDLGGIDIGTMNFTQNVVTRNNMGGIAGESSGIIKDCTNYGKIGYAHTGYNAGGIVGIQNGVVIDCTNEGTVYGRKDVGGIVGQAEPYVESEYLSDQLEQTKRDIDRINSTLDGLSSSLESTSEETKGYTDAFTEQFEETSGTLSERIDQMEDALPQGNDQAKGYMNNINEAMDKIEKIQNKEGSLTVEDIAEIQKQMDIIEENAKKLEEITKEEADKKQEEKDKNEAEADEEDKSDLEKLIDSLDEGINTLTEGIDTISDQTDTMVDNLYDSTAVIRGEKSYIVDVSSIKTAFTMDGVISGCINRGMVDGDLNVGGIAGTMNLEYGDDPEANLDVSEDVDIAISSEVNDVIIDSINYAKINGKKNYTGSIVGYQEFGYLYQCEGYGHVIASAGSYVGGIAGMSNGTIEKSYAMLDLCGQDYVGGIAGEGAVILDCLSVVTIDADGERIGSVAGYMKDDATMQGNYFVKDVYDAVDNISYFGIAERVTYEEIMQFEGVPEGFTQVQITFEVEGEIIEEQMIAYGSSLTEADFPDIEERDGYYIVWPEQLVYTDICNNLTVEAEYVPWTQSIAVGTENAGKPFFIAVGEFYEETQLHILPTEAGFPVTIEGMNVLYNYDWTILSEREKTFESVEGHFYVPSSVEGEVSVWIEEEGGWVAVPTTMDGSYVVAEIPYEVAFAVVETMPDMTGTYLTIGVVVVLLLVIFIVIVHNKRKKKAK